VNRLNAAEKWLDAHAHADIDYLRMGIGQIAKHPRRGPTTSSDAELIRFPQNAPHHREARVEEVPGSADAIRVRYVEGQIGTQLTMTRSSLGERMSETGFVRALAEILGDPPGWAAAEPPQAFASESLEEYCPALSLPNETVFSLPPVPGEELPGAVEAPMPADADPVVVVCTGCGNPLPTTKHAAELYSSPPCPHCGGMVEDDSTQGFRVLGELHLGHEDDAPESGVYFIADPDE
jgi:hypothetical protein